MNDDVMELSKEELGKLITSKIQAGATREQIIEHVRDKDRVIEYLLHSLAAQGASILDIREKMIEHKNAIELVADSVFGDDDDSKPSLIGFEEPKIVMPRKN